MGVFPFLKSAKKREGGRYIMSAEPQADKLHPPLRTQSLWLWDLSPWILFTGQLQGVPPQPSHSRTHHTAGHITQQDTSHSRTHHTAGHITQQDTSHSRTHHTAGHITQQDTSHSRTHHTAGHITGQANCRLRNCLLTRLSSVSQSDCPPSSWSQRR